MSLVVHGNRPLSGTVHAVGSKNAFHKLIAGCIAIPAVHHLSSVPTTGDADALLEMARSLGANIDRKSDKVTIDTRALKSKALNSELTTGSTGSFLFAGAMLGRFGETEIGPPGGDKLGERPVDRHLDAFQALGAQVDVRNSHYNISADQLVPGTINFPRDTVNGTANAILAAIGIQGTTIICQASIDPDVMSLIVFLRNAGYSIESDDQNRLLIKGGDTMCQMTHFRVPADRNDAVTFMIAGALCGGPVEIMGISPDELRPFVAAMANAGAVIESHPDRLIVRGDLWNPGSAIHLESGPFPKFMTDWGPLIEVLMTQLRGISSFNERVFTRRFAHLVEMRRMGARVDICDSSSKDGASAGLQTAYVGGPTQLRGTTVTGRDLRGVAALLVAGLIASGSTTIYGADHLERGYERLIPRLRQIGAEIEVQV